MSRLLSRVEGALGIGRAHFEDMQVVRYYPGEFYREHLDVPGLARTRQQRADALNPRILTAFVYLSDVPADGGGETAFTKLVAKGVEPVKPKLGRLLVWPNVWTDEPAIADRRMYHEARELKRGVKFGANIWIRLTDARNRFKTGVPDGAGRGGRATARDGAGDGRAEPAAASAPQERRRSVSGGGGAGRRRRQRRDRT